MISRRVNTWSTFRNSIILLLMIGYVCNSHADSIIDHVNVNTIESNEIVEIIFNQPVQYLYHTPKSDTETMLLGFNMHSLRNKKRSTYRPIPFKHTNYLQSIELYYEKGFNPHLYFEFNTTVNINIQPRKNLRGFILSISKFNKQ